MATEILMVKIRQCLKDLTTLAEAISKSEENEEKYAEIRLLTVDILGELAADNPNREKVEEACSNLKDVSKEYNDAGDNLDIKKASSGLASRIGTINPANYKEFLDILIQEDKQDALKYLIQSTGPSPGDLVKLAWDCYKNQHYDDAFNYALQAKNNQILLAYYLLGELYEGGLGTKKDLYAAYKVFLEGAQMGSADCQFQVYIHLLAGVGVNKNLDEAYEWLLKAAHNQHSLAMLELAKLCVSDAKYEDAYHWFVKSADAGDDEAKAWIGFCYEKGYGVARDVYRAKSIYNQEIGRGNDKAKELYENLLESERKTEEEKRQREEQQRRIEAERIRQEEEERKKRKKRHGCLWFILLLGILGAGYQFWYKGYKLDKESPRTYVYATNLFLRSSKVADVEYNRLGTIPYGSELITYSNENDWAYVKVNGKKGYVASGYLLGSDDFHLLNGVWGNEDAKEAVSTAKCRLAVCDYLKTNKMQTGSSAWQIYTKPKEMKPNSVLFPRLNDGYDNFTEFAFILKDNQTGNRKLVLYSFEEDETPVFRHQEDAPAKGDIKSITYSKWNNRYKVNYSNQDSDYRPPVKKTVQKDTQPITSGTIDVHSVVFANTDFDRNILTGYGQQLYSDMQYLTAKVSYRKQAEASETITLKVKIIKPDGTLVRGSTSPTGYTFEQSVTISGKEGTFGMLGWGNNSGNVYAAGSYRYEIWQNGTKQYSGVLNIKDKTVVKAEASDNQVYESVEMMPEFPYGGTAGMMSYLSKNIKYPTAAQETGTQGRVIVQFVVNKDGSIADAKVVKSVDPDLDKEAIRVVMSMPKWKPGKKAGKAVRVKYTVPINFKLA